MTPLEITLLGILLAILAREAVRSAKRRRRRRRLAEVEALMGRMPLAALDPVFEVGSLGPDRDLSEVVFLGGGDNVVPGSTTDFEAWILTVLAKGAMRMFEFGTCTGRTTYLWARNSPSGATITTITLAVDQTGLYADEPTDNARDAEMALEESAFTEFLYSGTDVAHKVEQLFGDSKAFDETPYIGTMDFIFVDGSHAYSYVMSDTRKALRMIKPGGLILWHDYEGPATGRGTDVALAELAQELPLQVIEGTRMVAYRAQGNHAGR